MSWIGTTRVVGGILLGAAVLVPIGQPAGLALAESDPVIAAAGDIACDPADADFGAPPGTGADCREMETSDLLVDAGLIAKQQSGRQRIYRLNRERLRDVTTAWLDNFEAEE